MLRTRSEAVAEALDRKQLQPELKFREAALRDSESQNRVEAQKADARYAQPLNLPGMIGDSAPMLRVYEQVRQAALTESSVVVCGESGTGKELVASALHSLSPRASGPFVDVNTAAIPQALIESELFGHVRGAFTGAIADRMGCFEAAHGGTIFIDEIGELELASQAKLLRTLETRRVRRVGSCNDSLVDTRVVAATNRQLEEMIEEGTFREDLYFRLNVVAIYLPPLRDRKSDIPVLIEHFLRNLCARMNRVVPRMHGLLMEHLIAQEWRGNVRQLRNCIESMLVMSSSRELTTADLPCRADRLKRADRHVRVPDGLTLAELEKLAIKQALARSSGVRERAAQSLGISVRTLQRKLRAWRSERTLSE